MDDGVADDAGGDGEYWEEHGKSPLLRFLLFCPGVTRTYSYVQNPCQKENAFFEQKSQGGKARTKCIYKIVCENTFSYAIKNRKGPAEAEPELFSKNANGFVIYRGMLSAFRQA